MQFDRTRTDAEVGVDSFGQRLLGPFADRADQGEGRNPHRTGQSADAHRRLAERALGVERAFAGQTKVGPPQVFCQLDRVDDELNAWLQRPSGEGDQTASQSSRRPRAGSRRLGAPGRVRRSSPGEPDCGRVPRPSQASPPFAVRTRPTPPWGRRADWSRRKRRRFRDRRASRFDRPTRCGPAEPMIPPPWYHLDTVDSRSRYPRA